MPSIFLDLNKNKNFFYLKINTQTLLTMYHSTIVLPDDPSVKVQGSLADSPFNTSTLGATITVTAAQQAGEKQHRKNGIKDQRDLSKRQIFVNYKHFKFVVRSLL